MAAEEAQAGIETSLVLTHAPGWLSYIAIAAAIGLAWWGWRRYGPSVPGVAGMIARLCRCLALILLVGLIAGPAWQVRTVTVEPGVLVYAVDRSASMTREDGPDERSRIDQAEALYLALEKVAAARGAELRSFALGGRIEALTADDLSSLEATGSSSQLGEDLMELAASTRPDAMVLISDGRVTGGSSLDAAGQRLSRLGLPDAGVWVLAVGSEQVDPQLRIDEIEIPQEVPLGERVPVVIRGGGRSLGDAPVVRMVLYRGDEIVATELVTITPPDQDDPLASVEFEHTVDVVFPDKGDQGLRLELSAADEQATSQVRVTVQERNLQVLLLADRPRYELRYLRDALQRDYTVTVHTYLADGRWRRWGDQNYGGDQLPLSPSTIGDYDVIIIGDLAAERLSNNQRDTINDAVRNDGCGLVWLPGALGNISGFRSTNLGSLIPVELGDAVTVASGYTDNVERRLRRTDAARSQYLLTIEGRRWADLPSLRTGCPVLDVTPGSTVLATDQNDQPLVAVRTYGSGRALFIGVDDTWRWRRQVGDRYLNRFWSQLLRYVSSGRGHGDQRWRVVATPHRSEPGGPLQLAVVPTGAGGDPLSLPGSVTVRLQHRDQPDRERLVQVHRPEGETGFTAQIPAPSPGIWDVSVADGLAGEQARQAEVIVARPGDELRDPRRDKGGLDNLATTTGGRLFDANAAAAAGADATQQLAAALPSLSHERQSTRQETLWDRWWVFALICALFAIDWAIRRANRLP